VADTKRFRVTIPWRLVLLLIVVGLSLLLCATALLQGWIRPDSLQRWVAGTGSWGILSYIIGVVLMELLWLPRMWGLLAAGFLFGPLLGCALSLVADLSAAYLCFMLARGTAREWVAARLARHAKLEEVVHLLAQRRGVATLVLLRVCPLFHFTLASYAAGLAGVRPAVFLLGTGLGILPGAIIYPLAGKAAMQPTSPLFLGAMAMILLFLLITAVAGRHLLRRGRDPSVDQGKP
jgi:uncharacterized membrane protein YdjX (TVP38/TMEM64 family)